MRGLLHPVFLLPALVLAMPAGEGISKCNTNGG